MSIFDPNRRLWSRSSMAVLGALLVGSLEVMPHLRPVRRLAEGPSERSRRNQPTSVPEGPKRPPPVPSVRGSARNQTCRCGCGLKAKKCKGPSARLALTEGAD